MPASEPGGTPLRAWVARWWGGGGGIPGHILDILLWPAEGLFRIAVSARNRAYDSGLFRTITATIPVVSIGNLGVGGTGKTPVAAWVARWMSTAGHQPALVLRGYGADEILVHRELNPEIPVFAAARRIDGVREAAAAGRNVAVLDDAFQHRALGRQLDLVLISADSWSDRRRLLPRGPWREGIEAVRRASLVVITRKAVDAERATRVERAVARHIPAGRIVHCRIEPTLLLPVDGGGGGGADGPIPLEALRGRSVLAVTSLADPRPFAAHLEQAGAVVEMRVFPDHHAFTGEEVAALAAEIDGRPMVMTRKEAVKLRPLLPTDMEAWMLEQRVEFESGVERVEEALTRLVQR